MISSHDWIDFYRRKTHFFYTTKGKLDSAFLERLMEETLEEEQE